MVLDGDLDSRINREAALSTAHLDRVVDPGRDPSWSFSILSHAENDTKHRGSHSLGKTKSERKMFFRGSPILFKASRSRTNAPGTKLDADCFVGGITSKVRGFPRL